MSPASDREREKNRRHQRENLPPHPTPTSATLSLLPAHLQALPPECLGGGEEGVGASRRQRQLKTGTRRSPWPKLLGASLSEHGSSGTLAAPEGDSLALLPRLPPLGVMVLASQVSFLAELGAPIPACRRQPGEGNGGEGAVSHGLKTEHSRPSGVAAQDHPTPTPTPHRLVSAEPLTHRARVCARVSPLLRGCASLTAGCLGR